MAHADSTPYSLTPLPPGIGLPTVPFFIFADDKKRTIIWLKKSVHGPRHIKRAENQIAVAIPHSAFRPCQSTLIFPLISRAQPSHCIRETPSVIRAHGPYTHSPRHHIPRFC